MTKKYVDYNDLNGDCSVFDGVALGASKGLQTKWASPAPSL